MPDLVVLMPVRNAARFIVPAVESVLALEKVLSVQLQIQDAASDDGTLELLAAFAGDPRVAVVSEPDLGQSDALNRALKAAPPSTFLGWLNADERYLKDAAAALALLRNSDADVVYGDTLHVDENNRELRLLAQHRFSVSVLRNYGCYIQTASSFWRRRSLGEPPVFDIELRRIMDWDLYLRLAAEGKRFAYLPRTVSAFTVHSSQVTAGVAPRSHPEHRAVRTRYEISDGLVNRRWGKVAHRSLKLLDGGYRREARQRLNSSR